MIERTLVDLSTEDIQRFQLNRYPNFFLDGVSEVVVGKTSRGFKTFSSEEWFFCNHFPGEPIVPGYVLIETLVQNFLMTFLTIEGFEGLKTNFLEIEKVKFSRKVIPGERLELFASLTMFKRGVAVGTAKGSVGEAVVCEAIFKVVVPDELAKWLPN